MPSRRAFISRAGCLVSTPAFWGQPKLQPTEFTAKPTNRPQTVAEVKPVSGVPTLVLDGKPYGPMIYTRCAATFEQLGKMADRNFPLHFEMVGSVGRPQDQTETFRRLDARMQQFLAEVPNARIILRMYLSSPPDFQRDYPGELLTFNDGSADHFQSMLQRPPERRGYPSFASEIWRRETAQALFNYVTHVRQSGYSKNIIGYFLCGGGTEEWYYWGDYDRSAYCLDFSKPMLAAFRSYLRAKYGTVEALRRAWNDPGAGFDTAMPPDLQMRRSATGVFWDPANSARIRDYYYVHSKVMEDSLLVFSRTVKQACNRQQLVGMFFGYLQNHRLLEGGQLTLKELLASPDVDFWSGPPQYDRRGAGEHGSIRFPIASLKQHGKLWIGESDIRTMFSGVSPDDKFARETAEDRSVHGRPADLEQSFAVLQREFAHQLCEGGTGWWFQMGRDWYHHEPILALFDRIQHIGEAAVGFDRTSDTDIASVVDMESVPTGPEAQVSPALLDTFKVQESPRIGAPVDHYELDEILAPNARRYKLYLMLNCFRLTDRERRLIHERLRRNGATLVWMYAPGFFNPEKTPEMSLSHIKDLLGFELQTRTGEPMRVDMKLTAAGASFFQGFDQNRAFGSFERPRWRNERIQEAPTKVALRQRFCGGDGGEVLARFVEGGEPSIVRRTTPRATDIWIGSVMAPADLLRSIARRAGCHLFSDSDDIVYANKSFLAIHTRAAGERTFHLRRRADVVDVFSGKTAAEGATGFEDTIEAYRTRLYFLGDREKWRAAQRRADAFFERFQTELKALRHSDAARAPQSE